jgi:hypothetical protein
MGARKADQRAWQTVGSRVVLMAQRMVAQWVHG